MVNVTLNGWEQEFKKVGLNRLLRQYAGLSLQEAKDAVDRLLNDEEVTVPVASREVAQKLVTEATQLGADCQPVALEESKSGFRSSD